MKGIENMVEDHPSFAGQVFAGLDEDFRRLVFGCAKNTVFEAGQYLFHEGDPANQFYLLRHGKVALQVTSPGRGALTFQTLGRVK